MISRRLWIGFGAAAMFVLAPHLSAPRVQLDYFGNAGEVLAFPAIDADAVHQALLKEFEPATIAAAMTPAWNPLAAYAAGEGPDTLLRAVSVKTIAPDHVRVRLAIHEPAVAAVAADEVVDGIAAAGLRKRLLMRSETTGGRAVLAIQGVALAVLAWMIGGAAMRAAGALSRVRPPAAVASR